MQPSLGKARESEAGEASVHRTYPAAIFTDPRVMRFEQHLALLKQHRPKAQVWESVEALRMKAVSMALNIDRYPLPEGMKPALQALKE